MHTPCLQVKHCCRKGAGIYGRCCEGAVSHIRPSSKGWALLDHTQSLLVRSPCLMTQEYYQITRSTARSHRNTAHMQAIQTDSGAAHIQKLPHRSGACMPCLLMVLQSADSQEKSD